MARLLAASLALAALVQAAWCQSAVAPKPATYVPANVVKKWESCPVANAAGWDASVFDASAEALVGLMSFAEGFPEKCQNALLALATDCASDSNPLIGRQPGQPKGKKHKRSKKKSRRQSPGGEDGGASSSGSGSSDSEDEGQASRDEGGPAPAPPKAPPVTSLSTSNGCCLQSCAATFKEAAKDGCFDRLMGNLCQDPAGAKYASGLQNAATRCANHAASCAAPAVKAAAAAAPPAATKAPPKDKVPTAALRDVEYDADNVVRTWEECPVSGPRQWDAAVFNATVYAFVGLVDVLGKSVSVDCREAMVEMVDCVSDNDAFATTGAVTSFSTVDGCCLKECSKAVKATFKDKCFDQAMQTLCSNPKGYKYAIGLHNAAIRCTNYYAPCALASTGAVAPRRGSSARDEGSAGEDGEEVRGLGP